MASHENRSVSSIRLREMATSVVNSNGRPSTEMCRHAKNENLNGERGEWTVSAGVDVCNTMLLLLCAAVGACGGVASVVSGQRAKVNSV